MGEALDDQLDDGEAGLRRVERHGGRAGPGGHDGEGRGGGGAGERWLGGARVYCGD